MASEFVILLRQAVATMWLWWAPSLFAVAAARAGKWHCQVSLVVSPVTIIFVYNYNDFTVTLLGLLGSATRSL